MSCHKHDLLRELSCTHSRFRNLSYYLKNPYFTFYKRSPSSLLGCKNSTEKQSPNRVNPYRSKARIATEGHQVSPKRNPRKHQQRLKPIQSAQKLQNLQQWQERDALDVKQQKLRQFIQNYDKAIKEWQIRAIAEKQDFVGKISQIKERKVKAFSMKKKTKEYNGGSHISAEKSKKKLKEAKSIIETHKNETKSPKKTENKPKRLKTIQNQMVQTAFDESDLDK